MKRPLMTLLGLFLLGLLAGSIQSEMIIIPILAAAGIMWRSICHLAKKQVNGILLLFLFALGYLWNCGVRTQLEEELDRLPAEGEEVVLTGTVTDVRKDSCILKIGAGRILVRFQEENFLLGEASEEERDMTGGASEEKGAVSDGILEEEQILPDGDSRKESILPGRGLRVEGIMESLQGETNPGGFDSKTYYESEGVIACVRAESIHTRQEGDRWLSLLLSGIREKAKEAIGRILPEREAGVLSAMLLGERTGLDRELKELYQKNGIAHILAISGLHVSLLGAGLMFLLIFFGLSRWKASGISILFLVLYGLMTGFSPATLRAVIMQSSVQLAGVFRRVSDMPTAMTLSLFLILLLEPYRITSSGMLMSFLAAAAVAAQQQLFDCIFRKDRFLSVPRKLRRRVKILAGSVLMSFLIQLFLLPVMMRDYYCMTPYSPLLNLLVVPLLTVAVGSGALGMLVALIPGLAGVGTVLALPCRGILMLYEWLCRTMVNIPGQEIVTGHISDLEMLCMMLFSVGAVALLIHFLRGRHRMRTGGLRSWKMRKEMSEKRVEEKGLFSGRMRKGRRYAAALVGTACCTALFTGYGILRNHFRRELVFFYVGQGDGCLLHTESGTILMDFGSSSRTAPGEDILIPGLRYYGITRVDLAVLSHTDIDHTNAVQELLEKGEDLGITTSAIALAEGTLPGENREYLLAAAEKSGTSVVWLSAGDELALGKDVKLEVLYPGQGETGEGNDFSLVLMLSAADQHILFTGDIGAETEEKLCRLLEDHPHPDILKVAHHGSAYSSSEIFLKTVRKPGAVAIISCGRNNIYGHPASSTLQRLQDAGYRTLRTDRNGAVIVELP